MEEKAQLISTFRSPARRAVVGLVCAISLTGTAACTGAADAPSAEPSSSTGPTPTPTAKAVPMTLRVTQVSGRLPKSRRATLRRAVRRTVEAYVDAAFLAGDLPRTEGGDAFASFTKGAARKARRDRDMLTNADLGAATSSVTVKRKKVSLSVLAPNRSVAGVTARIRLVYVADRGEAGRTRVTTVGRLLLTRRKPGRWQIFGYDVARSAAPVKVGASR